MTPSQKTALAKQIEEQIDYVMKLTREAQAAKQSLFAEIPRQAEVDLHNARSHLLALIDIGMGK